MVIPSQIMKGAYHLNRKNRSHPPLHSTVENLAQAIFTVNRHAKTAPNPKYLYKLKHEALKKMISEGKAKKSDSIFHKTQNCVNSSQQSLLFAVIIPFIFHRPKMT